MITVLPESTETTIGFSMSGKVTAEDYDVLLPKMDEAIKAHGKINMVVVMGDFSGYSGMEAAKDDFKFGTHQYRQVERAAFVGDKKRLEWMIKLMSPFTRHTQERFFSSDLLDEAWQWAQEAV